MSEERKGDNIRFVIYIIIVLLILFIIGSWSDKESEKLETSIYHEPGVCSYCETKLQKTVIDSYGKLAQVVWYCPNPDCEH